MNFIKAIAATVVLFLMLGRVTRTLLALPAQIVALGYSVFWLAYPPRGRLLTCNRMGDDSCGTYIHGFPLQGFKV